MTDSPSVVVLASGTCLPGAPVSNEELIQRHGYDTTPEWISAHTGIDTRHFASAGQNTGDLAAEAALTALSSSHVTAASLQRILVCTTSPNWLSPATACDVQRILGAGCPASDVQSACASFLFGLDAAYRLVRTGVEPVMVIGADTKSRFVGQNDRALGTVFSDGAGALILGSGAGAGIRDILLWSDGRFVRNLLTPAGGSDLPASVETVNEGLHNTQMRVPGREIADAAIAKMTELTQSILDRNGLQVSDVACFVPHQANLAILKEWSSRLRIPESQIMRTISFTGNNVAATIPIACDFLLRSGRLSKGDRIVMVAVGGGYSGGAVLYEMPGARV